MRFDGRRYRPMGLLDLLDEAFDLYKKNFALLVTLTGIIYVPVVGVVSAYYSPQLRAIVDQLLTSGSVDFLAESGQFGPDVWFVLAISFAAIAYGYCAVVGAVASRYLGKPVNLGGAFRDALHHVLPVLVGGALFLVLAAAGTALCWFPGAFVVTVYGFFAHVMLTENTGSVLASFKRSGKLVAGQGVQVFIGYVVLALLAAFVGVGGAVTIYFLTDLLVNTALPFIPTLGANKEIAYIIAYEIMQLFMLPFQVCAMTMLYYDLKVRKEGYDMEILANSLGYPSIVAPAPVKQPKPKREPKVRPGKPAAPAKGST